MKFRIKDLEKYLNKKLDWQKVAQELTMKSFETVYNNGILEVDILPNRYADASSLIGLVKEIAMIRNLKYKVQKPRLKTVNKKFKSDFLKVDQNLAPYYFGRIILNVKNKPSPDWLKEFVEFYGFNSVNFLVDLANFVMIEYGAPLHIFDLDKIKENIFVRLAKKGEKFISLEGKEYKLTGNEIVISDEEKILGLAGIKGSKTAEIDLNTKNIFIEAAVFDSVRIYQTSRELNLRTEASFRFERKVAPIRALQALNQISYLINKNLGGEILAKVFGKKDLKETKIKFDFGKVKKFTGLDIKKSEILNILKKLGIKIKGDQLIIPLDRLDLQTEEDIVEEIIRIYDLNKIKAIYEISLREIFVENDIRFNNILRNILIKTGYNEGHNYSFYGDKEKSLVPEFYPVEVLNPISENYKYFQSSLIPNLLKSVYINQFNFKEIKIFEITKVACNDEKHQSVSEKYNLGIVYAQKNAEEILKELKGILNIIALELGLELEFKEVENELFVTGVKIEGFGIMGLINKKILEKFDIDLNVGIVELNINNLKEKSKLKKIYKPWPVFPQVVRDLSFFINEKIKFNQIKTELEKIQINYLEEIKLVDIYFPEKINKTITEQKDYLGDDLIESGLKSMTIRFIFSHPQRSLTDEEVNLEMEKIKRFLKEKYHLMFR